MGGGGWAGAWAGGRRKLGCEWSTADPDRCGAGALVVGGGGAALRLRDAPPGVFGHFRHVGKFSSGGERWGGGRSDGKFQASRACACAFGRRFKIQDGA